MEAVAGLNLRKDLRWLAKLNVSRKCTQVVKKAILMHFNATALAAIQCLRQTTKIAFTCGGLQNREKLAMTWVLGGGGGVHPYIIYIGLCRY